MTHRVLAWIGILVVGLMTSGYARSVDNETPSSSTDAAESVDSVEPSSWFGDLGYRGALECYRLAGFSGGIVPTINTWELVGSSPIVLTGSPVLALSCDYGGPVFAATFGVESAPWHVQRAMNNQVTEQLISMSFGLTMGAAKVRYGPMMSLGLGYLGIGARGQWLPWRTESGAGRGFELRVLAWMSGTVAVQTQILFTMTGRQKKMRESK